MPLKTPPPPPLVSDEGGGAGWWQIGFKIDWPENTTPKWHVDLFIAHRIVAPALNTFEADIKLWRYHRRAYRDATGHQFSFLFYSTRQSARRIYRAIDENAALKRLVQNGTLANVVYSNIDGTLEADTGAKSDESWPPAIQRTWPYYIMGVSRMWLGMIQDLDAKIPVESSEAHIETVLSRYAVIDQKIQQLWRTNGQHAFLHHLNALFGYEPLIIRDTRLMQF